jgi:hypothetical protein
MVKNVYREQMCLNGMKGSKQGESLYKSINGKAVLQLPEQKNRRKSFKSVWPKIECSNVRRNDRNQHRGSAFEFVALGLSFRKLGPGILCTTVHRCILRAFSPSFWRNEGSPCYSTHTTPLNYSRLTFSFAKLKTEMKGSRFWAVSSIQQAVTRELKAIREESFSWAFNSLYERCKPCVEVRGYYTDWQY